MLGRSVLSHNLTHSCVGCGLLHRVCLFGAIPPSLPATPGENTHTHTRTHTHAHCSQTHTAHRQTPRLMQARMPSSRTLIRGNQKKPPEVMSWVTAPISAWGTRVPAERQPSPPVPRLHYQTPDWPKSVCICTCDSAQVPSRSRDTRATSCPIRTLEGHAWVPTVLLHPFCWAAHAVLAAGGQAQTFGRPALARAPGWKTEVMGASPMVPKAKAGT